MPRSTGAAARAAVPRDLVAGPGGRQILLADPDGNLIELSNPPTRQSHPHGTPHRTHPHRTHPDEHQGTRRSSPSEHWKFRYTKAPTRSTRARVDVPGRLRTPALVAAPVSCPACRAGQHGQRSHGGVPRHSSAAAGNSWRSDLPATVWTLLPGQLVGVRLRSHPGRAAAAGPSGSGVVERTDGSPPCPRSPVAARWPGCAGRARATARQPPGSGQRPRPATAARRPARSRTAREPGQVRAGLQAVRGGPVQPRVPGHRRVVPATRCASAATTAVICSDDDPRSGVHPERRAAGRIGDRQRERQPTVGQGDHRPASRRAPPPPVQWPGRGRRTPRTRAARRRAGCWSSVGRDPGPTRSRRRGCGRRSPQTAPRSGYRGRAAAQGGAGPPAGRGRPGTRTQHPGRRSSGQLAPPHPARREQSAPPAPRPRPCRSTHRPRPGSRPFHRRPLAATDGARAPGVDAVVQDRARVADTPAQQDAVWEALLRWGGGSRLLPMEARFRWRGQVR